MYCVFLGRALQTVNAPNASVGSDQTAPTIITGQTAETSIATDDTILIHDTSASALRKMTRANFVSGVGGVNTPYAHIKLSANQSTSNASNVKVTLDSVELDSASGFDATNDRWVVPSGQAGKYFITAQFAGSDDTTTSGNLAYVVLKIRKNGSGYQSRGVINFSNNPARQGSVSVQAIVDLNGSSDFVDISAEVGINDSTTGRIVSEYARASGFKLIGA